MKSSKGERIFYYTNTLFLTIVILLVVLPIISVISTSLSSEAAVLSGRVYFWPVDFTFASFASVLKGTMLIKSMYNTMFLTVVGIILSMLVTISAAYPLSKKRLDGRNVIMFLFTFTMLFNAGVIPNFMLIRSLKLMDSYWSIWLSGAMSVYLMIVLKSFFESVSDEIEESAKIDGCNDIGVLIRIVLPVSLPAIVTIMLYYAVSYWNSYMNVLFYISTSSKYTLQIRLRELLNANTLSAIRDLVMENEKTVAQESLKSACIVIASVPILLLYPVLQRNFVKGIMIGSVKG